MNITINDMPIISLNRNTSNIRLKIIKNKYNNICPLCGKSIHIDDLDNLLLIKKCDCINKLNFK
jgi:hypothetical protein